MQNNQWENFSWYIVFPLYQIAQLNSHVSRMNTKMGNSLRTPKINSQQEKSELTNRKS